MAGLLAASIEGGASDFWQRVWLGAGRTAALGALLLWEANSVLSTGICCAYVHTGVGESVTEFCWRAVRVSEAAHSLAAVHRVVRISFEFPRRTGALGRVVLSDADGLWSTHDGVTGGDTFLQGGATHFFF